MKKSILFICMMLTAVISLSSCSSKESEEPDYGYAASSIAGKTLMFDTACEFYWEFNASGGGTVHVTSLGNAFEVGFDSNCGKSTFAYSKTSGNSATFKATVPYASTFTGKKVYSTANYNLTLFFITPSEGYASGTFASGNYSSNVSFVLL